MISSHGLSCNPCQPEWTLILSDNNIIYANLFGRALRQRRDISHNLNGPVTLHRDFLLLLLSCWLLCEWMILIPRIIVVYPSVDQDIRESRNQTGYKTFKEKQTCCVTVNIIAITTNTVTNIINSHLLLGSFIFT